MPSRPSATNKSNFIDKILSPSGIVALLVIILVISGGIYLYARRVTFMNTIGKPAPPPTPTPTQLLPDDGVKGTYNVGQGKHDGPTVSQIIFNPLDVKKGQQLEITMKLTNVSPIQEVTGSLQMDNKMQTFTFQRTSGTDLDGMWQTTITLEDGVQYDYKLAITAKAANGINEVQMAPRSR
jgi:hypothetical protein